MDIDIHPQDHASLDRPLPAGAALYARRWTGVEAKPACQFLTSWK
jgi:hypothetical protein